MRQKSNTPETPSERLVRDIRRATRKQYSAEEKIRNTLASVRGLCIFAPSTCAIDRLQSAACELFGSHPILFSSPERSEPVLRAKKCANSHFFLSPFNDLSRAQTGLPFSGFVLWRHRYTVHGRIVDGAQHENPQDPDVRCHEQGIAEPRPCSTSEAHPSIRAAKAARPRSEFRRHGLKVGSQ
jgi:hypothetical protein